MIHDPDPAAQSSFTTIPELNPEPRSWFTTICDPDLDPGSRFTTIPDPDPHPDHRPPRGPPDRHVPFAAKYFHRSYTIHINDLPNSTPPNQTNLLEHVRLIQRAVVSYAIRVCGTVEEDDDTTAEVARDALAAIEKMRLTASTKRGGAAAPDAPAEVPAAPTAPAVEAPTAPVVETVAATPKPTGK